jgi:hypothetical protein
MRDGGIISDANQTTVRLNFTARSAAIAHRAAVESSRSMDEWVRDSVRGSLLNYDRLGGQPEAPGGGLTLDQPLPLRVIDRYVRTRGRSPRRGCAC